MKRSEASRGVVFALAGALVAACGPSSTSVVRGVDGRTVEGRFVAPEQYALFLRGALAQASGQLEDAIAAYEKLAASDKSDAEVFTRLAEVRCAR